MCWTTCSRSLQSVNVCLGVHTRVCSKSSETRLKTFDSNSPRIVPLLCHWKVTKVKLSIQEMYSALYTEIWPKLLGKALAISLSRLTTILVWQHWQTGLGCCWDHQGRNSDALLQAGELQRRLCGGHAAGTEEKPQHQSKTAKGDLCVG